MLRIRLRLAPVLVVASLAMSGDARAQAPARKPPAAVRPAAERTPPARFADPDRASKLARAFPEIDKAFLAFARNPNVPGVAWGVVIDGALVHAGATGVRDTASNAKAMPDSVFRIASMTKNF